MESIDGKARTVSEVLKGKRYAIDYYQREYRWQLKHVQELVEDLTEQFLASYRPEHARSDVAKYGHYFLGSIILSSSGGQLFIVDGQQRLTSLTLLLIFLHRRQIDRPDRVHLDDLIYSTKYGVRDFNIAVPERAVIMDSLFKGVAPNTTQASESVQTIVARYGDLEELVPSEVDDAAMPFFCDWLAEKVYLVEITAANDEDAYTIFETMNDRGLSLSPLDMLKGYFLANIKNADQRAEAARVWRDRVEQLRELGKDEPADAVKAWLRAQYAESTRERNAGAANRDFERIGTEFHRWVGDHEQELGLTTSDAFFKFICEDFRFYTLQYQRLRKAAEQPAPELEPVYHLACFNFTLQYPLLLAPLKITDSPDIVNRKVRTMARFLDILCARRAVNFLTLTAAAMNYAAFLMMRDARGLSLPDLVGKLSTLLGQQGVDFDGTRDGLRKGFAGFGLNQWSKRYIKVLLARMTSFLERQAGMNGTAAQYLVEGKGRFEIEHIWADHYEEHFGEFSSPADFAEYRHRFGDLLLLPKTFNAAFGDLSYEKKREHYFGQNLLAQSLHENCYHRNPQFLAWNGSEALGFRPLAKFCKAEIDERQAVYRRLADQVWNPEQIMAELVI